MDELRHTDGSCTQNVGQNKLGTEEHIWPNSIYIKFKRAKSHHDDSRQDSVHLLEGRSAWKGHKGAFWLLPCSTS